MSKMKFDELPTEYMITETSNPRFEHFKKLEEELFVVMHIERSYGRNEEIGQAFDGAFTALHIEDHIAAGADEDDWLVEILGLHQLYYPGLSGPFYDTLKYTLEVIGMADFMNKAIDYIIDNKGKLV